MDQERESTVTVGPAAPGERDRAREAYEQLRLEHARNLQALAELRRRQAASPLLPDLEARVAWNGRVLAELRATRLPDCRWD